MSKKTAQVVTGARGPESRETNPASIAENQAVARAAQAKQAQATKKVGEVVYQSKAAGLVIQLTAPAAQFDPRTGRYTEEKPRAARFRDGVLRVKVDDVLPDGQLVTERLEAKNTYGVNRDFWRVEDMTEYRREQEAAEFARKFEADPKLRELILSRLAPTAQNGFAPPAGEGISEPAESAPATEPA